MNDENNNLNGNVMGESLENNPYGATPLNNPAPSNEGIDSLDVNDNPGINANNDGIKEGGQFFNLSSAMASDTPSNDFNAMPGFESVNSIGTVPPISFNQEITPQPEPPQKKPKKLNKIVFVIIIIIALLAVGGGTYYILRYSRNNSNINITPNNIEINLGEDLPADSSFANVTGTTMASCTVDKSKIDVNNVGTYEFTVTCGNVSKKGEAKVIDNVVIDVVLKDVFTSINEPIEAKDFFKDPSSDLTFEFTDNATLTSNLGAAGEYEIPIKITNASNKTREVTGKLFVTEAKIKGFLSCTTNPQNVFNTSATMTLTNRFSIADIDTLRNTYGNLGFKIYTFTFTDESEYTTYLANYRANNKVVINDISSDNTTFDDTNKTITMTEKIDNTQLFKDYGETIFNKYTDIKNYFSNTLGQTCVYEI